MPNRSLDEVAGWIRDADTVVVLTGAGISTESGIPDFRGPQGVWTKNPAAEKTATLQHYMGSRDVRVTAWQNRLKHEAWTAQPNKGHLALVDLEKKGKLHTLVTQNVDGLHQAAGSSPDIVVEVHGNIHEVMCMECDERAPMERALARVRAGEDDPPCRSCGGILKSATISFGQNLVPAVIDRAIEAAANCDILLALGTTLTVYPVAAMPQVALDNGARLVIVNQQETPYDPWASATFDAQLGDALPQLVTFV
jgi:NAD-dependent deacetylase